MLCWLVALPVIMALIIFVLETVFGAVKLKASGLSGRVPRTAILMPAHNEATMIAHTLSRIGPVLSEEMRLLVVADNCTDETARIVTGAGHEVIERTDPQKRGKGYALAFGRDHLRLNSPECVIVFDADCETDAGSMEMLAKYCHAREVVVQARYVMEPDLALSPKVQISNFAFWIKNVVRQRGVHRLGGAAVLVGTGMAFPWSIFDEAPLATSNIVEDLALGLHLTQVGHAPVYLEEAVVVSAAANETATLGQRTRWEHGFLATAKSHGLGAVWRGLTGGGRKLFQLGLHLLVPPLAFLLFAAVALLGVLGALAFATGYWPAAITLALCVGAALLSVLLNWIVEGHRWLGFAALLRLPMYLVWKIPVYLRLARGNKVGWERTERSKNDADR